jgi:hypothetical protein
MHALVAQWLAVTSNRAWHLAFPLWKIWAISLALFAKPEIGRQARRTRGAAEPQVGIKPGRWARRRLRRRSHFLTASHAKRGGWPTFRDKYKSRVPHPFAVCVRKGGDHCGWQRRVGLSLVGAPIPGRTSPASQNPPPSAAPSPPFARNAKSEARAPGRSLEQYREVLSFPDRITCENDALSPLRLRS